MTHDGASAISIVLRLHNKDGSDYILQHEVLVVGENRIDEMAADLLADVDKNISDVRAILQSAPTSGTIPAPTAQ
jgi:hypothetical protein